MSDLSERIKQGIKAATSTARVQRMEQWLRMAEKEPLIANSRDLETARQQVDTCRHLLNTNQPDKLHAAMTTVALFQQKVMADFIEKDRSKTNKKNAEMPRSTNVELHEDVIAMGRRLAITHDDREITGIIYERKNGAPSKPTIRKILREAGILKPPK